MAKFHINGKGVPAICKAKAGNCPFGGADSHFDNIEDAQVVADKNNEANHGILPANSSITRFSNLDLQYSIKPVLRMMSNDVSVTLNDGTKIDGILTEESTLRKIKIMQYGDLNKDNTVDLQSSEIKHIYQISNRKNDLMSKRKYLEELRENNKARPEFRFSLPQVREMNSKFVKIEYDGKKFDGQVVNFHNDGEHESGFIIQNHKGEMVKAENYKLTSFEVTGNDAKAHENHLINDEIIYNIEEKYKEDDEYITITPEDAFDGDFEEEYEPQAKIEAYFDSIIRVYSGEDIDLSEYENINWYSKIEDNKEYYKEGKLNWNGTHGATFDDTWTENSESKYEEAYDMADNAFIYYEERQDLIRDVIKEVKSVDWTPYHNTQLEGEIASLRRIQREGIIST